MLTDSEQSLSVHRNSCHACLRQISPYFNRTKVRICASSTIRGGVLDSETYNRLPSALLLFVSVFVVGRSPLCLSIRSFIILVDR